MLDYTRLLPECRIKVTRLLFIMRLCNQILENIMENGDKAPDFNAKGLDKEGNEKEFTLEDFKGKNLVLYFYPMDDTPACTIEANDFNDDLTPLKEVVEVVGVSRDDLDSHKDFKEKYGLEFVLLSDLDETMHKAYGVVDETDLEHKIVNRSTFLIDKDGNIKKIWRKVAVDGHVEEILKELKDI